MWPPAGCKKLADTPNVSSSIDDEQSLTCSKKKSARSKTSALRRRHMPASVKISVPDGATDTTSYFHNLDTQNSLMVIKEYSPEIFFLHAV